MTQIQEIENLSQPELVKLVHTERQQHADDMDILSKELANRTLMVPKGWLLAPLEATREMMDEAQRVDEAGYHAMYEAMLAAAPAAPVAGPQLVQVYKINDLSGSVDSDLSQPCTCPSGDGSLRWPCPVHPPEPVKEEQNA